jgi:ribosomal protein S18 acetylase RimI-like enzyme
MPLPSRPAPGVTAAAAADELRFESATAASEAELLRLMHEFYLHERLPWDESRARAAVGALRADPALGRIWLFRLGAEAAGYLALTLCYSLEFAGRFALVDELYVREGLRGRGIGTRALQLAIAAAGELGVAAVRLEVDVANQRGMQLYRRLGFELQERHLMSRWLP